MFRSVPSLGTSVVLIALACRGGRAAVPTFSVSAPAFTDTDDHEGELKGTVTWSPPSGGNVRDFNVYLSKDAQGTDRLLLGTVPFGTNQMVVPENTKRDSYLYFIVYTKNEDGEQNTAVTSIVPVRIYDKTLNPPTVSPSKLVYDDMDSAEGYVSATLEWTPPGDPATMTHYKAYLTDGVQTGTRVEIAGSEVPIGTNYVGVAFKTQKLWTHVVVYALNPMGMNVNTEAYALVDFSAKPPTQEPRSVKFVDTDADGGMLGGIITWQPPYYFPPTKEYLVYLGVAEPAPPPYNIQVLSRNLVGRMQVGMNSMALPSGTSLAGYTHVFVYSKNLAGESESPAVDVLSDSVLVSDVSFIDTDMLPRLVGGQINWTKPALMPTVTAFAVYVMSGSTSCTPGMCLAPPSRLPDAEVPADASSATLQSASLPGRIGRVEVWARSGAVWAHAPAVLALEDQAIPQPPAGIDFRDEDLDAGELGGPIVVRQDPSNVGLVVEYRLHWGSRSQNTSDVEKLDEAPFAIVPVPINHTGASLTHVLPEGTLLPVGATHVIAFSVSKAGRLKKGAVTRLVDRIAPTVEPLGLLFEDQDPLAGELMGDVLVSAAPDESNITRYLIYWGREAGHFGDPIAALPAVGSDVSWFLRSSLPANTTHLVVLSANGDGAMARGPSIPLVDFVKTSKPDILVDFLDVDLRRGLYGGIVKVSQVGGAKSVGYNLYLGTGCCTRLELLSSIEASSTTTDSSSSGSMLTYEIKDGSAFSTKGATHILVFEVDTSKQESPLSETVELIDRFLPAAPKEVSFTDMDPRVGRFGGTLILSPGTDSIFDAQVCYSVFFGTSLGAVDSLKPLMKLCTSGGKEVQYNLGIGTVPPSGATHFVVVAANEYGEAPQVSVELIDNASKDESFLMTPVQAENWNISTPAAEDPAPEEKVDSEAVFWGCVCGTLVVTLIVAAIVAYKYCQPKPEPEPAPQGEYIDFAPKPAPVIPEPEPLPQEPEPEFDESYHVPEEQGRLAEIASSEDHGAQLGQPSAATLAHADAVREAEAESPNVNAQSFLQHEPTTTPSKHREGRVVSSYATPSGNQITPPKRRLLCGECVSEQVLESQAQTSVINLRQPEDPTHIYAGQPDDLSFRDGFEEEASLFPGAPTPFRTGVALAQSGWTPVRNQTELAPSGSQPEWALWETRTPWTPSQPSTRFAGSTPANVSGRRIEL